MGDRYDFGDDVQKAHEGVKELYDAWLQGDAPKAKSVIERLGRIFNAVEKQLKDDLWSNL